MGNSSKTAFVVALALISVAATASCSAGGSGRCSFNSDCAAGHFCAHGACTSECTDDASCVARLGAGAVCTTFGMCVGGSDAGAPDDAASMPTDANTADANTVGDAGRDAGLGDAGPGDAAIDAFQPVDAYVAGDTGCTGAGRTDADGDGYCAGATTLADCDDHAAAVHPGATETCNGIDDDCNGMSDDVGSTTCSTACGTGTLTCPAPGAPVCSARAPVAEACNHGDDDCDAIVDEGFTTDYVYTAFSTLSSFPPGCGSSWLDCNQSIHAFCGAGTDRCGTSGYGPVEFVGDAANVICVQATVVDATFADLTAQHGGCDSSTAYSIQCLAAINRLCNARGLSTGFGPVRIAGESISVACVPTAVGVGTTYTQISMVHPNCNAGARMGPYCVHAYHHYCINQGYTTGFGPLEHGADGDSVLIACIP